MTNKLQPDTDPVSDSNEDPRRDPQIVLQLIGEIGQQERHFNESIDKYKTMASTWLLAVFGAIGFILANKIEPWLLYAGGIGLAGSIGILLLWIIDIRVYQQLLASAFREGRQLEKENAWLPRTRHNMVDSQRTGSVTINLSWFYVLGVSGPLLIFSFSISTYILLAGHVIFSIVFFILIGVFIFFLVFRIRFRSKEEALRRDYVKEIIALDLRERKYLVFIGIPMYIAFYISVYMGVYKKQDTSELQTMRLRQRTDAIAPDGSEIRLLPSTAQGGTTHRVLLPGQISKAVQYKTVEEIWYVLSGEGEIWRKNDNNSSTHPLVPGTGLTIPLHTQFQFRNTGKDSLKILIVTMPPWPDTDEALFVDGPWRSIIDQSLYPKN